MGYEVSIYCDSCSGILVSASSLGEARKEGKRDKSVFVTASKKDMCKECFDRYQREVEQLFSKGANPNDERASDDRW